MSEPKRKNNILSLLIRVGLSAILLGYIFSKIDFKKTWSVVKTAQVEYIIFAFFVFLGINVILIFRWFIFIRAFELKTSLIELIRYYLFGLFGNLFLPSAIGGDIIKIVGLCKNSTQKPRVVASVLLDRLSGIGGIVIVGVVAFVVGYKSMDGMSLLLPIVLLATGALAIVAILFNEKAYSLGCKIFNRLPKVKNSLMQLHYDIALLRNRKIEGFKAIGLSCLTQVIFACCYFLIAKALHQDINLIYFLIFVPLICMVASLPSIGGLGVREVGTVYLFAKIGVDSGIAVSISLINFMFMVLVGLIGGAFYVATISSGRLQHHSSDSTFKSGKS